MLLAAAGVGDVLLHKYRFHSLIERLVFTVALGFGLYASLLFVMGLFGLLYRPIIWGLTIVGGGRAIWLLGASIRSQQSQWLQMLRQWKDYYRPSWLLVVCLFGLGLAYAGLLFYLTQYPPHQWDAISNHLILAREYLLMHRVTMVPGVVSPVLLALNHLLFTWALALQDDILAQMVVYSLMMLVALGLYAWGKRQKQSALGVALAAFWLAHPLVRYLGAAAYVDIGLTCYVFLGLYALRIFKDSREASWLYLSLALLGMAAGSKMTGLFFLALALAYSLWACFRSQINWKMLAQGWGIGLLIALPWFGFVAYHTGNPLWPMPFPFTWSPRSDEFLFVADSSSFLQGAGVPKTFLNFLKLPIYLATQQEIFFKDNHQGYLNIIALWPLAFIVAIWNRSVRWWVGWALAFTAFWFITASYLRYLLPAIPLIGLCLGESLAAIFGRIWKSNVFQSAIWVAVTFVVIGWNLVELGAGIKAIGRPPVNAAGRKAFLGISYYGVQYVNAHYQMGDTVFILGGNYVSYYLEPRLTGCDNELGADPTTNALVWPGSKRWREKLKSQNVTWILLQHEGFGPPREPVFQQPGEPAYDLVFASGRSYVFHRSPVPPALSADVARLKSPQGGCDESAIEASNSLPDPSRSSGIEATYEGHQGNTDCGTIDGWVWNMKRPNCPISVDIYDGDTLLTTVLANKLRDDLVAAGKGDGNHSFVYLVPAHLKNGKPHSIRVKVAGTNIDLGHTPQVISCPP